MGEAGEDTAIAPPPPPMALDSAAGDSASSTSTVRSRNASYTAGAPDGVAAAGSKPPVGSGLSRLGFAGPAAAAAAAAALTDAGPGPGRGPGTPSSREVPWLAPGGSRSGGVEGASGGEESDAVPDMAGARLSRLGDRSSGSGAPAGGPPLPAGTSVPLPSPGVRGAALPFSASMPHGPRAPGQLQPVASGAPAAAPAQRDASAFRFDPALLASLRLAPSGSVSSSVPPSDSAYGAPADPGTAGPGDHPRPGAAHHLSFTHHAGRPQGHPSGVVTCSEDTDTDGRPSESGPSYAGLGGVRPSKASFTSRPPPGPNSARRRGGEALQPRPSSGAHLEAVATAAANQVAALLQNPLPSIPSGGLAPGAEDPGIQTLLSLGLVNAAAYRRARQRASEAGGAGVANVGPGGGGGGGAAGSGPQHFAYQQQMMMAQMPGGSPGPGVPGRKMRRSSCTEAYGHGRYAHPQQGYGYGSPHNRQLQNLGTMSRAEGGNSGGGGGGGGGRSHLNADAAFGMVRRTASVAMSKDAQAAIAAAAAAATAAADAQGAGGNSGRGRQRRMSYNVAV
ncbi:hypothetical protein HXX76_007280 [Chlamydomonas incerta]|uniref:Uncharacterized protein n=1 Tax=Chlamydomonas incerta TaxID=51695 RepID=A0A835T1A4_CHLIN|nr:hypothetical protein HXX76_007280 [Chlamydomonas incerta]|eukprot:KAG2435197.1 hypothetical protein HXX76_007280 [Chlamydomonas incerta]